MSRNRRLPALLLCAGILLFLLTSSVYILLEAHHDCDGDDCEVCGHIARLEALLQDMARLGALHAAGYSMLLYAQHASAEKRQGSVCAFTLVGCKTRLND